MWKQIGYFTMRSKPVASGVAVYHPVVAAFSVSNLYSSGGAAGALQEP